MYKNKNGDYIAEGMVVKDIYDRFWYVQEITKCINKPHKVKCRNGCSFCYWTVDDLTVVY